MALYALVALYLVLACGFAIVTPYGEAPDEFAHVGYIEHLVRFHKLPEIVKYPYSYESFQPPLYYMVGAALVISGRAISGSRDPEGMIAPPARVNPERDKPGRPPVPNVLLHPPGERWPFWPFALRGYSMLLGLATVVLTYATARTLVPRPAPAAVPIMATAFAALIPQANFIRASVSNENMGDLGGALIAWLLVLHLNRPYNKWRAVWLGVALGLGMISKITLAPLALPALFVLWARRERPGGVQHWLRDVALLGVPIVALAGWFFAYRWVVYGDPFGAAATHIMLPAFSTFHLSELFWFNDPFRWFIWTSFWGVYGWQLIWMAGWIYDVLTLVTLLAVAGCAYLLLRGALNWAQRASCAVMLAVFLLVFSAIVYVSLDQVVWQGRELFPALSSVCVLLGLGLGGVALGRTAVRPGQIEPWRQRLWVGMAVALTVGLVALNVYSIFGLVLPLLNS